MNKKSNSNNNEHLPLLIFPFSIACFKAIKLFALLQSLYLPRFLPAAETTEESNVGPLIGVADAWTTDGTFAMEGVDACAGGWVEGAETSHNGSLRGRPQGREKNPRMSPAWWRRICWPLVFGMCVEDFFDVEHNIGVRGKAAINSNRHKWCVKDCQDYYSGAIYAALFHSTTSA